MMELGEVVNRYIRADQMKANTPSATISAPVLSNENLLSPQRNVECTYSTMAPPPPLVKLGADNLTRYNKVNTTYKVNI